MTIFRVVFVESFCCNTKKSLQIYTVYLGNKLFSTIVKSWYNNIIFLRDSVIFKWVSRTLWWTERSIVCLLKLNMNIKIHLAKERNLKGEKPSRYAQQTSKTKTFFPASKNINVWNCKQKCNWIKIKRTVHFWSIYTNESAVLWPPESTAKLIWSQIQKM